MPQTMGVAMLAARTCTWVRDEEASSATVATRRGLSVSSVRHLAARCFADLCLRSRDLDRL